MSNSQKRLRRASSGNLFNFDNIPDFNIQTRPNQVIVIDENDYSSLVTLQLFQEVNVECDRAVNKVSTLSLLRERLQLMNSAHKRQQGQSILMYRLVILEASRQGDLNLASTIIQDMINFILTSLHELN